MLPMETQQHSPEAVAVYPESFPNVKENSIYGDHEAMDNPLSQNSCYLVTSKSSFSLKVTLLIIVNDEYQAHNKQVDQQGCHSWIDFLLD